MTKGLEAMDAVAPEEGDDLPTIRSRLIWLVLACIVPAALLVVGLIYYSSQKDRAAIVAVSIDTSRAIMSAVDRELVGVQAGLAALATSPYLASSGDLAAFYAQSENVLTTLHAKSILLIDPKFQQVLNTLRPFGSALPSEANHPVLARIFHTGEPVRTDLMDDAIAQRPLIVVAVPVRRDGTVIYVLAATVWPEALATLLHHQGLSTEWIAAILDSTGTTVARTHQMGRFLGKEGSEGVLDRLREAPDGAVESRSLEGIPVVAAFSRSPISNWAISIGIPTQVLNRALWEPLEWLFLGTALLLLASVALAWAIGRSIAHSVHRLAAPALALGLGAEVTVPRLPLREADEVGRALTRASAMLMAAQHRACHDALTGLANRAHFDDVLGRQLAFSDRTQTPLSVLLIDLDAFKPVNDVHGHAAGDAVLCIVANRLTSAIRQSDLAARLGGDEFALILTPAGAGAAQIVAAKLIESLSAPYRVEHMTLYLSACIGIASYPEAGATSMALTRRADEALYKAKATGKQRYCVSGVVAANGSPAAVL
ncbi:GGDEF domain-containing protein [Rhodomicrobium vannielii]|nr:sensor domain-containing diguanylate cyclase [Rhodomicrobium vannielii]